MRGFEIMDQLLTNELLVDEIKSAETFLNNWNASWLEKVIKKEPNPQSDDEKTGVVEWYNIDTKKAIRKIIFRGNGDINLTKENKGHGKNICYDAGYNVNYIDFFLSLDRVIPTGDYHNPFHTDYINVSLRDNILTEGFNDITVSTDLNTGKKRVQIKKRSR